MFITVAALWKNLCRVWKSHSDKDLVSTTMGCCPCVSTDLGTKRCLEWDRLRQEQGEGKTPGLTAENVGCVAVRYKSS